MKTKKMILGLVIVMSSTQIIFPSFKNSDNAGFIQKKNMGPNLTENESEYDISNIQPLRIIPGYYNYGSTRLNKRMEQLRDKI
jgi:hypothetical protein